MASCLRSASMLMTVARGRIATATIHLRVSAATRSRFHSALTWEAATALIDSNPVVAFTKSYCPTCRDLIERFEDANITIKDVVLDEEADGGDAIREKLRERTGQRNVPFVFVGGRFIAAQEVMDGMRGPGAALRPALEAAGAPPTGFFRT